MIDKFVSKRYWKNKSTPMGEVDELAKKYTGVINLSLGDPDIVTHEDIIHFAFDEARKGHTKYTDFRGDPELRDAIRQYYKEDFGVALTDEQVMVTASACLGMYLVLEAVLDDGDEVIIHAPYFTPYYQQIELARGIPIELDTLESEGFNLNIDRLEALITERTKMIVINSPNNPTGKIFDKQTLARVAELAIRHDLLILSDEIYGAFTFGKTVESMIHFSEIKERLIILNSFSKNFLMTGWRVGNIIAPPNIIRTCQVVNENVVFTAPSISQRAALYALKHRQRIQESFIGTYTKRVLYAAKRINQIPWMSVLEPEGTFYLLINIQKTGLSAIEVSKMLLDKAQVLTIPGESFGRCGAGYVRIACTVDVDTLKEAFDRIERIRL